MNTEQIDQTVRQMAKENKFSGVILLSRGDEALFSGTYGYASRSWRILNDIDMAYPLASVTKMFTAVAVLQLIERGLLSFDSKVANILKLTSISIPSDVRIKHLLMHTSGIPDYFEELDEDTDDYEGLWTHRPNYSVKKLEDFLPLFPNRFPLFDAGDQFSYNNAGYILLGLMIEKASGESYFNYVRKNVFARAGMGRSDFPSLDYIEENVAEGHIPILNEDGDVAGWRRNIYAVPPHGASDGGAFSSAQDLVDFMRALRDGKLLSEEMTKMILTPAGPINKEAAGTWCYGYGIVFVMDVAEVIRLGHAGDDPGISAKVFYYPKQNIDMIILGNQSHCVDEPAAIIHEIIMNEG